MEPEVWLMSTQEFAINPRPETDEFRSHSRTVLIQQQF